jgi:hypothetical protein
MSLLLSDLQKPILPDTPPEWRTLPAELYERIKPARGFYLVEEWEQVEKILKSNWLLLQNTHRWRCRECNNIHAYYTKKCIERPFNRLTAIYGFLNEKGHENHRQDILRGISLGTIVPITEDEAQRFRWALKFKGVRI